MELQYLLFYFALLASAASFSIPERFPDYGNNSLQDSSKCKCSDGRCVTDNRGNVKCVCRPKYALQDEFTCKPCDCGDKGQCIFTLSPNSRGDYKYEKKCVCDQGSAEKDGKCVDCYCGENSACEFSGEEKNCYCIEGYSVKDGKCTRCDCGFYGTCEFNGGEKQCTCDEGFLELNGICEECDCGDHGTCTFIDETKYCQCEDMFRDNKGTCEECNCGENAVDCNFSDGKKTCQCNKGFSDKNGVCEVCDCGLNSYGCNFYQNDKRCACKPDYVQKGDTCVVACSTDRPCKNGGVCQNGHCSCLNGTRGEFCEFIDGCDGLCPEQSDVTCSYDVKMQKPYCDCLDSNLKFNNERKQCQRTCDENERICLNGGECASSEYGNFCRCMGGTEGEFCEIVPECNEKRCGVEAKCGYDVKLSRAVCHCNNKNLSYDAGDERCKRTCDEKERICLNGGECASSEYGNFCRCMTGTEGEFCEIVPECKEKSCGAEAKCGYDVKLSRAVCHCNNSDLSYDAWDERCKKTCDEEKERCHNGGNCTLSESDHFCRCRKGTEGYLCDEVPECRDMDCGPSAICGYDVDRETAVCVCKDGDLSFDPRDRICKKTCGGEVSCQNGGKCDGERGFSQFCECLPGTDGDFCENVVVCHNKDCGKDAECAYSVEEREAVCLCRDESLKFDEQSKMCKRTCDNNIPCQNGGECREGGRGPSKFCECLPGTVGDFCENVVGCSDKDCGRDAECKYDVEEKAAVCLCKDKNLNFDEQSKKCKRNCDRNYPCNNGGNCEAGFCECPNGTSGDHCELVPACETKDCGNDARCTYSLERRSAVCTCRDERRSFDETKKTCKRSCSTKDDCNNGGRCRKKGHSAFCDCLSGTEGDSCDVVKDCNEGRTRCKGSASCGFDQKKLKGACSCHDAKKRYDVVAEDCKETCSEDATCHNGGLCMHHGDHLFCECKAGTSGNLCEDVVECRRGLCGKGGKVECIYNVTKEAAECKCKNRDEIFDPDKKTCKACDCGKNSISCRFKDGKKDCVCREGYEAKKGKCEKSKCTEKRCRNGKCEVVDDVEVCSCYEGYQLEGDSCTKLNCSNTPCYNGTCVVRRGNREECICQDGYSLKDGVCIRGACKKTNCYGGQCDIIDGELMCVCPKNFSLQGKGCYETVCKEKHCYGGTCVVNKKKEICTCLEGYRLVKDVCKKILCKKPCYGGECKFVDGKEECICPPGFSIFEGVCRENQAERRSI